MSFHMPVIFHHTIGIPIIIHLIIITIRGVTQKDLSIDDRRCLPDQWLVAGGGEVIHQLQRKLIPEPHVLPPEELQQHLVQGDRAEIPAGLYEETWKVKGSLLETMPLPAKQSQKEPAEVHRIERQLNQEVHPGEAADINLNLPKAEARLLQVTVTEEAAIDHQVPTNPAAVPAVPGLRPDEAQAEADHQAQDQVPEVPVEAVPGLLHGSRIYRILMFSDLHLISNLANLFTGCPLALGYPVFNL